MNFCSSFAQENFSEVAGKSTITTLRSAVDKAKSILITHDEIIIVAPAQLLRNKQRIFYETNVKLQKNVFWQF